ncbi:hypothetical protein ON003_00320 [Janibacter hoylei]|uniref:hypothetical protein n=1 Tax=Janibacter hoylei TaxID=364298 RepID=UPI0022375D40|nr:hypothetical protein [Janibacter hoylei]MCW4600227.1 hypothetical protein [Janibacter hoylei]
MSSTQTAVVDEVRRQVLRAQERLRAVRSQVLDQQDHITVMTRRVSGAEATIRSAQGMDDVDARQVLGRDIALEMEEARSSGRRAYTIGLEIARELQDVQGSISEVKAGLDGVDRGHVTPQERSDLAALSARVDSMAWAVALTRPAAAAVTESMLYAEDRARVVQEHTLSPLVSPDRAVEITPVELTPLATDLMRAAEVGSHLQVATSDTLRSAEVAAEHSELVSEAAHSRMAVQQQREIPGEAPGVDQVGPQW